MTRIYSCIIVIYLGFCIIKFVRGHLTPPAENCASAVIHRVAHMIRRSTFGVIFATVVYAVGLRVAPSGALNHFKAAHAGHTLRCPHGLRMSEQAADAAVDLDATTGPESSLGRRIFCNRALNMNQLEAIGFDLDYTRTLPSNGCLHDSRM